MPQEWKNDFDAGFKNLKYNNVNYDLYIKMIMFILGLMIWKMDISIFTYSLLCLIIFRVSSNLYRDIKLTAEFMDNDGLL